MRPAASCRLRCGARRAVQSHAARVARQRAVNTAPRPPAPARALPAPAPRTFCNETCATMLCESFSSAGLGSMRLAERVRARLGGARTEAAVLVLGLDNSGKSSLLRALRQDEPAAPHADRFSGLTDVCERAVQTFFDFMSECHKALQSLFAARLLWKQTWGGGVQFVAREAGGAARHRALWERQFARADALIFVVDASDHLRLVVAREELQLALAHPALRARRVPLLVLANKSDAPHALPAPRVAAALGLEREAERAWHVCSGSAASGAGLADAVAWLARQLRDAR
ncbi:ADP-ribosylation factor-like protein 6 [Battus philenor]|uniref:ADP-ribosylation factor-like protein 6 n=1 Tax=Battus philenor TaxID=42288 RepID=UPI0035D00FBC